MDRFGGVRLDHAACRNQQNYPGSGGHSVLVGIAFNPLLIDVCPGILGRTLVFQADLPLVVFCRYRAGWMGVAECGKSQYLGANRYQPAGAVQRLHDLPWRTLSPPASSSSPIRILFNGVNRRRIGKCADQFCGAIYLQGVLGTANRHGDVLVGIPDRRVFLKVVPPEGPEFNCNPGSSFKLRDHCMCEFISSDPI